MRVPTQQFDDRVRDLEALLVMIEDTDKRARSALQSPGNNAPVDAGSESLAILKASVFLVTYNLVESAVRTTFDWLYKSMADDGSRYAILRSDLRRLWIDQQFRGDLDLYSASPRTFHERTYALIDNVAIDPVPVLDGRKLPISGNVDADAIRNVCQRHGIVHRAPDGARGGNDLSLIREQRNNLAHGTVSFSECGRQYTVEDLRRITSRSVTFLRSVLRSVERYARSKGYRVQVPKRRKRARRAKSRRAPA